MLGIRNPYWNSSFSSAPSKLRYKLLWCAVLLRTTNKQTNKTNQNCNVLGSCHFWLTAKWKCMQMHMENIWWGKRGWYCSHIVFRLCCFKKFAWEEEILQLDLNCKKIVAVKFQEAAETLLLFMNNPPQDAAASQLYCLLVNTFEVINLFDNSFQIFGDVGRKFIKCVNHHAWIIPLFLKLLLVALQ